MQASRGTVLAVTLGDPAGVGPEVALRATRALLRPGADARRPSPCVLLIGDLAATEETSRRLRLGVDVEPCVLADVACRTLPARRPGDRLVLPLLVPDETHAHPLRAAERRPGRPSDAGARVAYHGLLRAIELAKAGAIDAICTAPINKEGFARAGLATTGHTEILAERSGAPQVRLMMAHPKLRIVLATTHLAIADVPKQLTAAGIEDTIRVTASHLVRWFGIARPKIAVAALNPHASDGGTYGDEEERVIAPAIARARAARIDAFGPVPADTLFSALGPANDAVIAMYHDQGLIPVKQLGVHEAVNVTLGLPFIRTSPDHGTAFDVAKRGGADPRSMQAALALALRLAVLERRTARSSPQRAAMTRQHRRKTQGPRGPK
jgi:4-hydroxythreonine-4-phosphate dehydrogenase